MATLPDRWKGPLCLSLAMALVGSTVVASAAASRLDPFAASLVRFGVATPLLLLFCGLRGETWPRLSRGEWSILAFQSAVGSLGYTLALVTGLRYASAADASVITGLMPIATGGVAVLALGERPGARLLLAIGLAAAGAVVVALGKSDGGGDNRPLGLALVFLAVLGEAVFALLNKRIKTPVPPLVVATIMSAVALALTLAPGVAAFWRDPEALQPSPALLAMAYYGVFPTAFGFWLWYAGAKLTHGARAAAFTAVAPISALALSVAWRGETLHWPHIVGMALVLAAIGLAATGKADT